MPIRLAIMGYRHGHITDVIGRLKSRSDAVLVATCEEHEPTRQQLAAANYDVPVFDSFAAMLAQVPCDAIGVGDYYARRGADAITALQQGKHVLSDKPICTSLRELDEIEKLTKKKLCFGCQLDLRDSGLFIAMRRLLRSGEIGDVHALAFNGQHPLMYGSRPGWYFEEGKHGGTINDIAIHAVDIIPWLTGHSIAQVNAARNWHTQPADVPHFRDAAQMMLTLNNGCGVLGDVSYFVPDSFGYSLPQYWRLTVWGAKGMLEASPKANAITLYKNGEKEPRSIPPDTATSGGYLDAFLRDIRGERDGLELDTAAVLHSARVTLRIQEAADKGLTNCSL